VNFNLYGLVMDSTWDDLSDVQLVAAAADVVRHPRVDPADSFVLHAPLELAARAALLPYVAPVARAEARRQITVVADTYEGFGPAVSLPRELALDSLEEATVMFIAALRAGELDDVDAAAAWIGCFATPDDLRRLLTSEIAPSLAAAAHGSIFLALMPRVAPRGELTGELLRPLARELGRQPEWRLTWFEHAEAVPRELPAETLLDALCATPRLGVPGSSFIYPLMSQVERHGVAAELLASPTRSVDFGAGARVTLRAAAWSMLQEPADHAPYGWSHCLTMPQAVLSIASSCAHPSDALAIAATYVVGFRAALAAEALDPSWSPPAPDTDLSRALASDPDAAAGAVWHAPRATYGQIATQLATRAAVHHDAHLAKYTLACLDAAAWDASYAHLYLAAAARLHGVWVGLDAATRVTAGVPA
jgi:hypothetical protein